MSIAREALLSPIEPIKTTDQVIYRISQAITSGVLKPGDQLPVEAELAAHLDVAQMTLRQALSTLRESGLIETVRGRNGGSFVANNPSKLQVIDNKPKLSAQELQEITDYRMAIENEAAALAAIRGDRVGVGELQVALNACLADSNPDLDHCLIDNYFHTKVAEMSNSKKLVKAASDIQHELFHVYHFITHPTEQLLPHGDEHAELIAAIAAKDPDRAWEASNKHLLSEHYFMIEMAEKL